MKKLLPEQEPEPGRAQPAKETGKSYATETQTQTEALAKKKLRQISKKMTQFSPSCLPSVYVCVSVCVYCMPCSMYTCLFASKRLPCS